MTCTRLGSREDDAAGCGSGLGRPSSALPPRLSRTPKFNLDVRKHTSIGQNSNFNEPCRIRAVLAVEEVMTPSVALVVVAVPGVPSTGWLRALKASRSALRCIRSVIGKMRWTEASTFQYAWSCSMLRPALPNVPASGVLKAQGLNHCAAVLVEPGGGVHEGLPATGPDTHGLPTRLARS